jgi:aminoglycoside phosphotransferase (APT) family kinase protein
VVVAAAAKCGEVLPGVSRAALAGYLQDRLDVAGPLRIESARLAGQGMSDDTILVEAADGTNRRHSLAIRRYRRDGVMRELVDPARHYRTLEALAATGVPAPRPLWWDPDGEALGEPCFAMERIEGFVPVPWSPEGRMFLEAKGRGPLAERFVSLLVEIHGVDWRGLGLGGNGEIRSQHELSTDQVALLDTMLHGYRTGPEPILADALAWLRSNVPDGDEIVLVHGDYRTGNLVYDDERVAAVLDWEFSQPGDPMRDVAWVLAPSNRVGSELACYLLPPERFVDRYERLSGRMVDWHAVGFWQVFHQVFNAICWMHAEHRIATGATTDLRMLRWSYTMPVMRQLVLQAMEEVT